MKAVYRCDYCDKMGTEEEIKAHEEVCDHNVNNRGCMTCKRCQSDGIKRLTCTKGKEIPEGKQFLHCDDYEHGEPELVGFMSVVMSVFKEKK